MDQERQAKKAMQDFGNRYAYISRLGEGSYGTVLLCHELSHEDESSAGGQRTGQCTSTLVAVKKFKWAHNDDMGLTLALREIRLLKSLSHPLIIPLRRAFFSRECKVYAVFPFIDGGCSQSVLKSRFPHGMPPARLKAFAWQLCLAVRYLHKQKVLHRDIKPANVLLSSDGTIRLCDFGLARRFGTLGAVAPQQSGTGVDELTPYVQTRPYRAPEVLLGQPYSTAADIWSLGATLAEMATGSVLLPGTSSLDQLWRILGALPGPRPVALQRAVDTLHKLDPAALSPQLPPEMCPKQLPGPSLFERLSRHGQDHSGSHHGRALAQAHGHSTMGGATPLEPTLVDFLMACLQLDPADRPTAEELLQLPYLAGAGHLFAGHHMLERLHTDLLVEVASATASATIPVAAGVGKEEAAAAAGGGSVAANGRLRSCKSGIPGCYQPQKQPINNGFATDSPPQSMVAAVTGATTLLPNPPNLGSQIDPIGSKVLLRAGEAAPKHRRSLSAGSRADALESVRAPKGAAGAPQRCPFHPADARTTELWKHLLVTSSNRAVMEPAMDTMRTMDEIPSAPPQRTLQQHQQQRQQQAPPPLNSAVMAMAPSRAVSMPRCSEPSSKVSQPRGLRKQRQQQQHVIGESGATMASSLDSTLGPDCWGRQLSAATATRGSKQSIGLGLLRRPRFRPGRVKKLPSPARAQQPPTATGVTEGSGGAPALGWKIKFNRNTSAPDLLQYGQDDISVPNGDAQVMALSCYPAGNMQTGASERHAWSQSVCHIDTEAGAGLHGERAPGPGADRQQTTQHAAAPVNGLDDGARGTKTAASRSETELSSSSSRMAVYKTTNAGLYSILVDAADPDVNPEVGPDADLDGPSSQCLPVYVRPQQSCVTSVPGASLQDRPQTATAVAVTDTERIALSRRSAWNAVLEAADAPSIAASNAGGSEGANVMVVPSSPGSSLFGGGDNGGSGHHSRHLSGGLDPTVALPNRWRPTCLGYAEEERKTNKVNIAIPVPILKSLPTAMMATMATAAATAVLPIAAAGANLASSVSTLERRPLGPTASSCALMITASGMVGIEEDCGFGAWPQRVATVGGTGGDDAQIQGGRSYGTGKSLCDSEDGWLGKVATWHECGSSKAVAAARGLCTATQGAPARGIQLTSPQLACHFDEGFEGAFRAGAGSIPPPRRRQSLKGFATLLSCLGVGRSKRQLGQYSSADSQEA
ncbi:hypothetical protein VaNZ11_017068 [Volvox africanus]|uniref:Protein kinase domain-containing protein n=1 Tax=Volvox africanus TaxID=51714 RepID=A0ABQ5SQS7_9CHLO|nr:hypothetical protein VaNZ11_017068 [Volvox africanus]